MPRNSSLFFSNEYGGASGGTDAGVAAAQSPPSASTSSGGAAGASGSTSRQGALYPLSLVNGLLVCNINEEALSVCRSLNVLSPRQARRADPPVASGGSAVS